MLRFYGRGAALLVLACAAGAASSQTTTYSYDALGRVVRAVESAGPSVGYDYDAAGNRLSLTNGVPSAELTVRAFSASSNAGGFTGLTATNGMRDQAFATKATSHVTTSESLAWIMADLGASQPIDRVDLAGPDAAVVSGGPAALSGALVETSDDAASWTLAAQVGTVTAGVYKTVSLGGGKARYVRVRRAGGVVGVGDFRLYSGGQKANRSPVTVEDQVETAKGQTLVFDPRANDKDLDGDALSLSAAGSGAAHGQVSFTSTAITYKPDTAYVGTDSFSYAVIDTQGASATGKVTVTVKDIPNRPPVVQDLGAGTLVDTPNAFSMVATDADNDPLSISAVSSRSGGGRVTPLGGLQFNYEPASGFTGTDRFTVTVSDGKGGQTVANVSILVYRSSSNNHDPVAFDDVVTASKGQPLTYDPRGNDTDVDHDILTITAVQGSSAQGGTVTRANDGASLTYNPPNSSFTGQDSFSYTIGDGRGGSSTARVTVNVTGAANTAPVANSDSWVTPLNATVGGDVRQNDGDADGDVLTIISVTQPAHGTAGIFLSGKTITYTPATNYVGSDSFSYTVSDGRGGTASAAVSVTVTAGANRVPTATAMTYTIPPNQSFTFDLTTGGKDLDGDPITVISADLDASYPIDYPVKGTLSRSSVGPTNDELLSKLITYTPPTGESGFTVKGLFVLYDGHGGGTSAVTPFTINVSSSASAAAPQAQAAKMVVPFGGQKSTNVEVLGSFASLELAQAPPSGQVSISGNVVTYSAGANFSGDADFTVKARGAGGLGPAALVDVTVGPNVSAPPPASNSNPVAVNDTVNDVAYGTARTIYVLNNDYDSNGDTLSLNPALPSPPSHGQAQVSGSGITYTPASGYSGADSLVYGIFDGKGGAATASVNITVLPKANQVPVAASDSATIPYGQVRTVSVLANDYDPDGDGVSLSSVTTPAHGTAVIASGAVTYTPTAGYSGADSFSYTVIDGRGGSASGSVAITVLAPPNTSPSATADSYAVAFNSPAYLSVRDNDSDPDGDVLSIASVTTPAHGSAVISGGQITYTPTSGYSGPDAFSYTVSDGKGGSASASVAITVKPQVSQPSANRSPVAADDGPISVSANTAKTIAVLSNDSDPDGDVLSITAVTTPAHGSAVIASGQVTYTPTSGYAGADSFGYTISDGNGGTASASVSVTVQAANRAPTAVNDTATTAFNTAKTIAVLANDSDPDGDTLSITAVTTPAHGTAVIASGQVTYTPTSGYAGADSFTYAISDGKGATASGTISITVQPQPNASPVAPNGTLTTTRQVAVSFAPNATDPDGDTVTITGVSAPAHGVATKTGVNQITYTSSGYYYGADTFTYTVTDAKGASTVGTVNVTVNQGAFLPPKAVDDYVTMDVNGTFTIDPTLNDSADGNFLVIGTPTATHGTIWKSGNNISFWPDSGYYGQAQIAYTISDLHAQSATAIIRITISPPPNKNPVANDNSATVARQTAVEIPLDFGDSDGDPVIITSISSPAHGVATKVSANRVSYKSTGYYSGPDSFTYSVSDGRGGTATGTVSISVIVRDNLPPTAVDDYVAVPKNSSVTFNPTTNDSDDGGFIIIGTLVAAHGTVSRSGSEVTYWPNAGYVGPDQISYTISDFQAGSASAVIHLTVTP